MENENDIEIIKILVDILNLGSMLLEGIKPPGNK